MTDFQEYEDAINFNAGDKIYFYYYINKKYKSKKGPRRTIYTRLRGFTEYFCIRPARGQTT